ncbi:hypothetical protein EYC84_000387 [Monilinia fructicola]|uniref:Uncharacterized protein n=1 Tax=Monilinia fructicola TaxID=38448 RepID=A0A5M9JSH5_MONFR|nr:hypothetical protein EYC84_000387 [Monilinia fructicola]
MVLMDKQFKAPCINISLAVGLFAFNQLDRVLLLQLSYQKYDVAIGLIHHIDLYDMKLNKRYIESSTLDTWDATCHTMR